MVKMSDDEKKIIAYIVGLDGKVRPLTIDVEGEIIIEETVVEEGY